MPTQVGEDEHRADQNTPRRELELQHVRTAKNERETNQTSMLGEDGSGISGTTRFGLTTPVGELRNRTTLEPELLMDAIRQGLGTRLTQTRMFDGLPVHGRPGGDLGGRQALWRLPELRHGYQEQTGLPRLQSGCLKTLRSQEPQCWTSR